MVNHTLTTAGLTPLVFLCADQRLLDIAVTEGLTSVNPNDTERPLYEK